MNKDYNKTIDSINYRNLAKELRGEVLTEQQKADCDKAREVYDVIHGLNKEDEEAKDEDV